MANKILVIQAEGFTPQPKDSQIIKIEDVARSMPAPGENAVFLAPSSLRSDANLRGALDSGSAITCIYLSEASRSPLLDSMSFLTAPRTVGVKNSLAKGSTIYSETFFHAGNVGERLDPCFRFARARLNPKRAVDIWGTFHSLLFLGISSLPGQGEKGTGERVDVQIGADQNLLAFTVRFDLPKAELSMLRFHPLLSLPREAVDFFELRYIAEGSKVELLALIFLKGESPSGIEAQSFHPAAALESGPAEYTFQSFGALKGETPENKRVVKGGFKKKFSETITVKADAPAAPQETTVVKGEAPAPVATTVVSGGGAKAEVHVAAEPAGTASPTGKSISLLESKIQGLENTLKQREALVAKLNKEIEEIKDPLKMGVISGIKDNQVEGLKSNITRLNQEIVDAQKREKDLLSVLDKAVQTKDEAVKKFKDVDTKLRASQGGNNAKITTLEKQLEDQKQQFKDLLKKYTELTSAKAA